MRGCPIEQSAAHVFSEAAALHIQPSLKLGKGASERGQPIQRLSVVAASSVEEVVEHHGAGGGGEVAHLEEHGVVVCRNDADPITIPRAGGPLHVDLGRPRWRVEVEANVDGVAPGVGAARRGRVVAREGVVFPAEHGARSSISQSRKVEEEEEKKEVSMATSPATATGCGNEREYEVQLELTRDSTQFSPITTSFPLERRKWGHIRHL